MLLSFFGRDLLVHKVYFVPTKFPFSTEREREGGRFTLRLRLSLGDFHLHGRLHDIISPN